MKKAVYAVVVTMLFLTGCDDSRSGGVKGAKGETQVKYLLCGPGESNCFLAARFKDLDGCQSHKDWAEMLCDRQSTPGKMICATDSGTKIGVAYCT
ncbi:MAG: hypothetical protein A2040_13810 [Rhodocyclales bacterium GWA2_65_19]|nr:MAG: hypothetical protein A2040_13810 [Rhodocyclales bacterium GWA2_65_19]